MPVAALAIPAAISAGASIFGAVKGSRAAKQAGQMQSEAALGEAQRFRDLLAQVNPQIGEAAERYALGIEGATGAGQAGMREALAGYGTQTEAANELLAPYLGLGPESVESLRQFMSGPGAGMPSAQEVLAQDPGYQFRIAEAAKALQGSAAARGGALGGGTLRALNQRIQDVASSEYGSAFDRLRSLQTDRFNRLSSLMGVGLGAAGQTGQNLLGLGQAGIGAAQYTGNLGLTGAQAAGGARQHGVDLMGANALSTQQQIADLMTGGAAARAAGTVGSANAWGQGLAGVAGAAGQAGAGYMQYKQGEEYNDTLRGWMNPALSPPVSSVGGGLPTPPAAPWQIPSPAQMPWYLRGTDYGFRP